MGNSPTCVATEYFSGQGSVLLAKRDGSGNPLGYLPVGNVSSLVIAIEREEFEHKESCTGARAIDLTITQEISATVTMVMESIEKDNLELALFGVSQTITGTSVVAENIVARLDKHIPLLHIKVTNVVVTGVAGTPVFVLNTDYTENLEFGTIVPLSTGAITEGLTLEVDYDFVTQDETEAITFSTPPERAMRFEGLNTARAPNTEVLVDVFRFAAAPLAELALIQDEIVQMSIEGDALVDSFKPTTGSQIFKVTKVV